MPKYTWMTGETFSAAVEVRITAQPGFATSSHAGRFAAGPASWSNRARSKRATFRRARLRRWATSAFRSRALPHRAVRSRSALGDTDYLNHYPVWIYPEHVETSPPPGVTVCQSFDAATQSLLAEGGTVVLLPKGDAIENVAEGGFATDFWCWPMFHNRPGTMGLLCDPRSPALAKFPTESHSNWQWFHLAWAAARHSGFDASRLPAHSAGGR